MNPWTLLGWVLLILVMSYVFVRAAIVVLKVFIDVVPAIKKSRKRKKADKGKVTCEAIEWEGSYPNRVKVLCPDKAEFRGGYGYSQYLCPEHTLRSRENRIPLGWTDLGKRRSAEAATTVVRSPRTK